MGRIPYGFEDANERLVPWPDDTTPAEREAANTAHQVRIVTAQLRETPSAHQHPYVFQGPNDVPFVSPDGDDLTPAEAQQRAQEIGAAALARQDAQRGNKGS